MQEITHEVPFRPQDAFVLVTRTGDEVHLTHDEMRMLIAMIRIRTTRRDA